MMHFIIIQHEAICIITILSLEKIKIIIAQKGKLFGKMFRLLFLAFGYQKN